MAGNNDYYLDLPSEEEVRIGDYKISDSWTWLLCKLRCGLFKRTCLEYGYDVKYGHTHVPYIEIGDDDNDL